MSKMTPIKVAYVFTMKNHRLKAVAEHCDLARKFTFYFDEKVVSERTAAAGDILTDDDCIRALVESYCKNHTGVYADLFKNHSNMVHLVAKTIDFEIENFGISLFTHVTVEKGKYTFTVTSNEGKDVFSGSFVSESFSEVLEKVRICTTILAELSNGFSENINELSNDKVEEWIKWD